MSKEKNKKIVQNDLKTLLKKFSDNDVISTINEEYQAKNSLRLNPFLIEDNHYLKTTTLDEKKCQMTMRSIGEKGILSPLIVRLKKDKYEVIDGRYRLAAAKKLQIATVPVIIHHFDDEDMLIYMLYLMRNSREVKSIEIALLCRALANEFHYTQQSLAIIMGVSRPQVTNLMRILNLPHHIIKKLNDGQISYGHAKSLVAVEKDYLDELVKKIVEEKLSVRDTEREVRNLKNKDNSVGHIEINEKKNMLIIKYRNDREKAEIIKFINKLNA